MTTTTTTIDTNLVAIQIGNATAGLLENIATNSGGIEHNVEAINSTFILTCTFLVFFMQAGFAFLEAGIASRLL